MFHAYLLPGQTPGILECHELGVQSKALLPFRANLHRPLT